MNFKNIIIIILIAVLTIFLSALKTSSVDEIINKSELSKYSIISVSLRNAKSEKIVYEKNSTLLLHPASTLKAFTTPVVLNTLGANHKISTGIYKDSTGNIYLKLCGDPQLKTEELSKLFSSFKSKGYSNIKGSLYIDDKAVDDISWGTGWMWDDDNNPYMPKYNAYNIDRNLIKIRIFPTTPNRKPKVYITPYYTVKIINNAITSNRTDIFAGRKLWKNSDTIFIEGKITSPKEIILPVSNPEKFFKYQLLKAIKDNNINFSNHCKSAALPKNAVLITEISRKLIDEIKITNKKSDNLAAELLFKLAGKKFAGGQGSTEKGLKAFKSFYSQLGADTSDIEIADASGVSWNDLITADWMTLALAKLYKTPNYANYKSTLATPAEIGTLQNRLLSLKGKLFAKTGTNAGVSAITGYLDDNSGNTYAFSILVQNFKGSSSKAKELEDEILKNIY